MKQKTKLKQTEMGKIPGDWEVRRLGKFFSLGRGFSYNGKGLSEVGLPMVNLGNIAPKGGFLYGGLKYWNKEYDEKNLVVPGDIVIANTDITQQCAVLGCPAIIPSDLGSEKSLFTHHIFAIRNLKDVDKLFLYYLLKSPKYRSMAKGYSTGTTVLALSKDDILNFKMLFPKIYEQKAIAKILSDLDAKIELNTKMNNALESLGKNLFKKKIIDLEEIPRGWETKSLDKIADFLNGLALQKYSAKGKESLPVIKIRELRQGITSNTDRADVNVPIEYIVGDGDILFSWSGSLEVVIWGQGKGALNQHLFKVSSKDYPKWFYYYWTKHHLPEFKHIAAGKATTMGHIKRHHLEEAECIVPDKKSLNDMTKVFEPIIERQIKNLIEIRKLVQIGDALLPKLMSGEVRVK